MLRRRIRSALFIDFENVALPADKIVNWLAWLEDGVFDEGQRRRFLLKRVYWNSSAEKHREAFKANEFEPVLCERFHGLPNSVDIRMAIDIVETTYTNPNIQEFILVTRDSDFVPVLQRLGEKKKKTVFVVNEADHNKHTTFRQHADAIIAVRELNQAKQYVRPSTGLLGRLRLAPSPKQSGKAAKSAPRPSPQAGTTAGDPVTLALDRVIKVTSRSPNKFTAQTKIVAELKSVPGFSTSGKNGYLGKGSYKALMKELARRDERLRVVDQSRGGTGVMYVPKADG